MESKTETNRLLPALRSFTFRNLAGLSLFARKQALSGPGSKHGSSQLVANARAEEYVEEYSEVEKPGITEVSGFETIGENWLASEPCKPILYLWGVGPARRTWVARFFPEFRAAFAEDGALWEQQRQAVDLAASPCLAIWGRARNHAATSYAKRRGIPLLRIDEGFFGSISGSGGANQPLSLVIDHSGIYYDGDTVSDLERHLLEYDFDANSDLVGKAYSLRKLYQQLKLARHILPAHACSFNELGPKSRRRVLVIGQVWNSANLIDLARRENPAAEIVYVPHPEIAAHLRSAPEELSNLNSVCKVLLNQPDWADIFGTADHVYTVNSVLGLDALIYGCRVTVTGAPFYAGWGLTDDRLPLPRRGRKLALDQLFCGVFLLYPRYLADPEDAVTGCLAEMLLIAGNRKRRHLEQSKLKVVDGLLHPRNLPTILRDSTIKEFNQASVKFLSQNLPAFFVSKSGPLFQKSVSYLIIGRFKSILPPEATLARIQSYMPTLALSVLVRDLLEMCPTDRLRAQWAAVCEKTGNTAEARTILQELLEGSSDEEEQKTSLPIPPKRQAFALQLAKLELQNRDLDSAESQFNRLLLSGNASGDVFSGLADIARLRFDFRSAADLMALFNHISPGWKAGRGAILEAQMAAYASSAGQAAEAYAWACMLNAEYTDSNAFSLIMVSLEAAVGALPYGEAMHKAIEITGVGSVIGQAKALIAHQRPYAAESMLLAYSPQSSEASKYCVMLSQAYTYQAKLEEAKSLIDGWLPHFPTLAIYREGFQLAILKNDYAWGWELIQDAMARNLDVGDANVRKVLLGLGRIRESYLTFRDMRACELLKTYLGPRYVQDIASLAEANRVTIIACFGPGDEIRFASFYGEFIRRLPVASVIISCDPRLHSLLQRSFPGLSFAPVARTRSLAGLADFSALIDLPGSDLHTFSDNYGWLRICESDRVCLSTDLLGDVIDHYESFSGQAYLKADPAKVTAWAQRLIAADGEILIGISWRSSLNNNVRNQHYLTIEELAPVLNIPGVRFVNLQYDDCSAELAWANRNFPGKIFDPPNIDQYNDFESVSALMSNLDLVIAPCTTVLELAGALGLPAFLLSNSSELYWRKRPGTLVDVWHNSVTHVEGSTLGDKATLVESLKRHVLQFSEHYPIRKRKHAC